MRNKRAIRNRCNDVELWLRTLPNFGKMPKCWQKGLASDEPIMLCECCNARQSVQRRKVEKDQMPVTSLLMRGTP